MAYREIAPPPRVASHVACLWWRTGAPPRVLPDGCVDLVWTGADVVVAGPATRSTQPGVRAEEVKLGVRFRVGAAGAALGLPAGALLDSSPPLDEVWSDGRDIVERVGEATDPRARLAVLVDAVSAQLARTGAPDRLVRAAVLDVAAGPHPRVADLGDRLGISERQLRRRFDAAVGYAPKTLGRVLRLQRFLRLAERGGDLARLAAEAGYADQPHLTRDCTRLTGLPAAALLATGAVAVGERLTPA
jgi:AraC-like DNA-binding protein